MLSQNSQDVFDEAPESLDQSLHSLSLQLNSSHHDSASSQAQSQNRNNNNLNRTEMGNINSTSQNQNQNQTNTETRDNSFLNTPGQQVRRSSRIERIETERAREASGESEQLSTASIEQPGITESDSVVCLDSPVDNNSLHQNDNQQQSSSRTRQSPRRVRNRLLAGSRVRSRTNSQINSVEISENVRRKRRKHDPDCVVVDVQNADTAESSEIIADIPEIIAVQNPTNAQNDQESSQEEIVVIGAYHDPNLIAVPETSSSQEEILFVSATAATHEAPPPPMPEYLPAVNQHFVRSLIAQSSSRLQILFNGHALSGLGYRPPPMVEPGFRGDRGLTAEERMKQIQEKNRQNAERALQRAGVGISENASGSGDQNNTENGTTSETTSTSKSTSKSTTKSTSKSSSKSTSKSTSNSTASNSGNNDAEAPAPMACPICMDAYSEIQKNNKQIITINTCGHVLCNSCLEQSSKSGCICPICRKRYTKKGIRKIFF